MKKNALVIMARYPLGADVKTRLSPALGRDERRALYSRLLDGTIARLRELRETKTFLAVTPDDSGQYFDRYGLPCIPQGEGDIGQRLLNALRHVLGLGYGNAAAVASDVPGLTPRIARSAFDALGRADLAIGPSTDGGYYLIGMKKPHPELFSGIKWSTPTVLKETLARVTAMGLGMEIVEILDDLDTPEDLERLSHLT